MKLNKKAPEATDKSNNSPVKLSGGWISFAGACLESRHRGTFWEDSCHFTVFSTRLPPHTCVLSTPPPDWFTGSPGPEAAGSSPLGSAGLCRVLTLPAQPYVHCTPTESVSRAGAGNIAWKTKENKTKAPCMIPKPIQPPEPWASHTSEFESCLKDISKLFNSLILQQIITSHCW